MKTVNIHGLCVSAFAALLALLLGACDKQEVPADNGYVVPEGMVEVRPVLGGVFSSLPRSASDSRSDATRVYPSNAETEGLLENCPQTRLPESTTVWLIARNEETTTTDGVTTTKVSYEKRSFVVYNSGDDPTMSYLVPCTVDNEGKVSSMEGSPLFLRDGKTYTFYAISPARELRDDWLKEGKVGFSVANGQAFYANDCRYEPTTPQPIAVENRHHPEAVCVVPLAPMMNQTALLRFRIRKGSNVHDLDIQPAGIQISGLQEDDYGGKDFKDEEPYGDETGLFWRMAMEKTDEPFVMKRKENTDSYRAYDYTRDGEDVCIDVPVLPLRGLSEPIIIVLRLKVNGVPTAYQMMLNEKEFKAGYVYGYRGTVNAEGEVTVISWQFVSWEEEIVFPDFNM